MSDSKQNPTNAALDGASAITRERIDQIEKHGFTLEHDERIGAIKLAVAAQAVLNCESDEWPDELDEAVFHHIMTKTLEQQWAIAGAFLAAAIDARTKARATTRATH